MPQQLERVVEQLAGEGAVRVLLHSHVEGVLDQARREAQLAEKEAVRAQKQAKQAARAARKAGERAAAS